MASPTEIANAAVAKLGDVPIQALPPRGADLSTVESAIEFSEAAQMCGATYYIHRDALLASYPWSWATRRSQLQRREANDPGYPYTYWLPPQERGLGVGVRAIYDRADGLRPMTSGWTRTANGISSREKELWGEWIENVPETQWTPALVNALVLRLCSEWAYYFTDQANLTQFYDRMAIDAFQVAARLDAQSKPSQGFVDFEFIDARYRGGSSSRQFRTG